MKFIQKIMPGAKRRRNDAVTLVHVAYRSCLRDVYGPLFARKRKIFRSKLQINFAVKNDGPIFALPIKNGDSS